MCACIGNETERCKLVSCPWKGELESVRTSAMELVVNAVQADLNNYVALYRSSVGKGSVKVGFAAIC